MTRLRITFVLGTNKLQASIGTAVALFKYYKGGLINFRTVVRGLVAGFIGACLGSLMVLIIDSDFMNFVVPVLLVFVFVFSIFNKNLGVEVGKKRMSEPVFLVYLVFY